VRNTAKRRSTKVKTHINDNGRTERATEKGVEQAGLRRHCGRHLSVASLPMPENGHLTKRKKLLPMFLLIIPYYRAIIIVFRQEEWSVGAIYPLYLKFWVKPTPLERKRRFSIDSASAVI